MNIYTVVSLAIAIAGLLGGIITAVAKLALKTGRIMERVNANEKRDDEERERSSIKFTDLYNRMSAAESEVKSQGTAINSILATCTRIENKLDRYSEAR